MLGAGTPGNPFSPPVKFASGEFSKKYDNSPNAKVIIAK